jgi:A/G-specific adenine glycosylase
LNPATALSPSSSKRWKSEFRRLLLGWYRQSRRDLPWRRTRDPYQIWLSEIMLQQTRVEAVLPYYEAFLKRFPTVEALAGAPEPAVLAMWSGLGYYSRARNLQRAAREVAAAGSFPKDYAGIRALAGVGDYTAAAIASIAFDLPFAAVDGNVLRVIARVCNDPGDIGALSTRRRFQIAADEILDRTDPGDFNQGMMELGATICLPRNPKCLLCPVRGCCAANEAGTASELPIKLKRATRRAELVSVVIVRRRGLVLMRQRPADAVRMAGFWELPALEDLAGIDELEWHGSVRHTIVDTDIEIRVHSGSVKGTPSGMFWIAQNFEEIPITTVTRKALSFAGFAHVTKTV